MKKVLFAIAALATCMSASAQLWVSGGLNIDNTSNWGDDKSLTEWGITPSVGYALDDALEVGLNFGLSGASKDNNSYFKFKVAPFARYTFLSEGDFSMFLECEVGYENYKIKDQDADWSFNTNIQPGVKYVLTDNFAMVAKLGGLYYQHNPGAYSAGNYGFSTSTQNKFGLNIGTNLQFSLVYSF